MRLNPGFTCVGCCCALSTWHTTCYKLLQTDSRHSTSCQTTCWEFMPRQILLSIRSFELQTKLILLAQLQPSLRLKISCLQKRQTWSKQIPGIGGMLYLSSVCVLSAECGSMHGAVLRAWLALKPAMSCEHCYKSWITVLRYVLQVLEPKTPSTKPTQRIWRMLHALQGKKFCRRYFRDIKGFRLRGYSGNQHIAHYRRPIE